jgi:hypothetical protein
MGKLLLTLIAEERRSPDEAQIWAIVILGIITALGQLLRKRQEKRQPPPKPTPRGARTGLPTSGQNKGLPRLERPEGSRARPKAAARARPVLTVEPLPARPLRPPTPVPPITQVPSAAESALPGLELRPAPRVERPPRPAGLMGTRLARLLRSRQDARMALALSEVLSPPLALR